MTHQSFGLTLIHSRSPSFGSRELPWFPLFFLSSPWRFPLYFYTHPISSICPRVFRRRQSEKGIWGVEECRGVGHSGGASFTYTVPYRPSCCSPPRNTRFLSHLFLGVNRVTHTRPTTSGEPVRRFRFLCHN